MTVQKLTFLSHLVSFSLLHNYQCSLFLLHFAVTRLSFSFLVCFHVYHFSVSSAFTIEKQTEEKKQLELVCRDSKVVMKVNVSRY